MGCFERVQLESRGLHEHSVTELEPQTDGEKGLSWMGERKWWASSRRCSVRSKTIFHRISEWKLKLS